MVVEGKVGTGFEFQLIEGDERLLVLRKGLQEAEKAQEGEE